MEDRKTWGGKGKKGGEMGALWGSNVWGAEWGHKGGVCELGGP